MNPAQELIIDWLLGRVAEMLAVDRAEIDCAMPFVDVGLSSIQAVEIAGDLERWTELTLSPTIAFDFPTIEGVADHVVGQLELAGRILAAQTVPR